MIENEGDKKIYIYMKIIKINIIKDYKNNKLI